MLIDTLTGSVIELHAVVCSPRQHVPAPGLPGRTFFFAGIFEKMPSKMFVVKLRAKLPARSWTALFFTCLSIKVFAFLRTLFFLFRVVTFHSARLVVARPRTF